MAQPINCDMCNENLATFMTTIVGTGDVFALCPYCAFPWAMAVTHELPGGDELMKSAFTPEPAKPKRSRARAEAAPPVEEATDEPTDEPTDVVAEPVEVG